MDLRGGNLGVIGPTSGSAQNSFPLMPGSRVFDALHQASIDREAGMGSEQSAAAVACSKAVCSLRGRHGTSISSGEMGGPKFASPRLGLRRATTGTRGRQG